MNTDRGSDSRRRALLRGLLAVAGLAAVGCLRLRTGVGRVCRAGRPRGYPGPLRRLSSTLTPGPWAG